MQTPGQTGSQLVCHRETMQSCDLVHAFYGQKHDNALASPIQLLLQNIKQRAAVGQAGQRLLPRSARQLSGALLYQTFKQGGTFQALTHQPLQLQSVVDALKHLKLIEGFGQKVASPQLQCTVSRRIVNLSGQENHGGRLFAQRLQLLHHLKAVHVRHAHVEQNQVRALCLNTARNRSRITQALYAAIALILQQRLQQFYIGSIVIDNQNIGVGV